MGNEKPLDHNEATQLKRTTTNDRAKETKEYLEKQMAAAKVDEVRAIQAKV